MAIGWIHRKPGSIRYDEEDMNAADGSATGSSPLVSVIIPAYQATPYIADTLDSVLAQTFTSYEVILVNDASPDTKDLERAIEPYRNPIVYIMHENRGQPGPR